MLTFLRTVLYIPNGGLGSDPSPPIPVSGLYRTVINLEVTPRHDAVKVAHHFLAPYPRTYPPNNPFFAECFRKINTLVTR